MRSALPQAGLVPPKWQVLTPRTMISTRYLDSSVLPRHFFIPRISGALQGKVIHRYSPMFTSLPVDNSHFKPLQSYQRNSSPRLNFPKALDSLDDVRRSRLFRRSRYIPSVNDA